MSAVTIVSAGAKSGVATASAVDVSSFSTLRLNAAVLANLGKQPYIDLYLEQAPASTGPWRALWSKRMETGSPPGNDNAWTSAVRIVLSGFDSYVRARWSAVATANIGRFNGELDNSPELNLAITGDGKPDA
ncbi:MAG TPA: hypothetical protein VJV79_02850 [Polyangiaceae bacterium]|nr:hypothetical protein [Polyangiaceae bacterium]